MKTLEEIEEEERYVPVPRIDPKDSEDYAVFRETFLQYLGANAAVSAFRKFGMALNDLAVERSPPAQVSADDPTAEELRAVVADLRFLQGHLRNIIDIRDHSNLPRREARLCRFATRMAEKVGKLADEIEKMLAEEPPESEKP